MLLFYENKLIRYSRRLKQLITWLREAIGGSFNQVKLLAAFVTSCTDDAMGEKDYIYEQCKPYCVYHACDTRTLSIDTIFAAKEPS